MVHHEDSEYRDVFEWHAGATTVLNCTGSLCQAGTYLIGSGRISLHRLQSLPVLHTIRPIILACTHWHTDALNRSYCDDDPCIAHNEETPDDSGMACRHDYRPQLHSVPCWDLLDRIRSKTIVEIQGFLALNIISTKHDALAYSILAPCVL